MKAKTKRKPKRPNAYSNLPIMGNGGYTPSFFDTAPGAENAAGIPSGKTSSRPSSRFNAMGTLGMASNIGSGLLSGLAASNQGAFTNPEILPGQNTTQQLVDQTASSLLPFYGLGKAVDSYAKTDYAAQDQFGALKNTNKYIVADTIGMFLDPAESFISGLNGEGWTPQQRANRINDKSGATLKRALLKNQPIYNRQMEDPSLVGTPLLAAYGGDIGKRTGEATIRKFLVGDSHEKNPSGGVPVDAEANPASITGKPAVASVEEGEVAFGNFIFSNRIPYKV